MKKHFLLFITFAILAVGCSKPSLEGHYKYTFLLEGHEAITTIDFNKNGTLKWISVIGTETSGTYVYDRTTVSITWPGTADDWPGGKHVMVLNRSGDAFTLDDKRFEFCPPGTYH